MPFKLREYGTSFATRERAREIAEGLLQRQHARVVLDLSDVMCSPSFLAELLVRLAARAKSIVLVDCDREMAMKVSRLITQLDLSGRVSVEENAIPA